MGLGVDHDRSVDVAAPEREVVHADGAGLRRCRVGQVHHPPQQRGAAGRHAHDPREAGTGPARQGQPDLTHRPAQPLGDPAVAAGQSRRLLHERPSAAGRGRAEESPNPQRELCPSDGSRQICRKPHVGAVDPFRPVGAVGTGGPAGVHRPRRVSPRPMHVYSHDGDPGDRREQQLPGQHLVHSQRMSAVPPARGTISRRFPHPLKEDQQLQRVTGSRNLCQTPVLAPLRRVVLAPPSIG
ncbi:hypothetical protein BJY54_000344 [Streptomyces nodosus]|nr:hypothetical protein [Streptomyces nodosus]